MLAVSEPIARRQTVGDHQRLVADEEVGDFVLVGLQLVVGLPDVGVDIGGVLQLDHRDRQAVDEDDDIGTAQLLAPLDGELVDDQKLILLDVVEVDQLHMVGFDLFAVAVFDRHSFEEQLVEGAVVVDQH